MSIRRLILSEKNNDNFSNESQLNHLRSIVNKFQKIQAQPDGVPDLHYRHPVEDVIREFPELNVSSINSKSL